MALFEFLSMMPLGGVFQVMATVLIILFFVTSADSGALVMDYLTAKSDNSPIWQRLFWTALVAFLAIVLLLAGGLKALQSATIMSALPFTVIMLLICIGMIKALKVDVTRMQALQGARTTPYALKNPRSWQQRLGLIMHYPHSQAEVDQFIQDNVRQAFLKLEKEFDVRNLEVQISEIEQGLQLSVDHLKEINFIYQVVATETAPPSFMADMTSDGEVYYQAEVFLRAGGQGYDVMEWTVDDLLQDIIDQYERHLHFLSVVR